VDERLPWDVLDHGLEKSFLARELRRGIGAKVTPKCAVESCRACGLACADHPELVTLGAGTPSEGRDPPGALREGVAAPRGASERGGAAPAR